MQKQKQRETVSGLKEMQKHREKVVMQDSHVRVRGAVRIQALFIKNKSFLFFFLTHYETSINAQSPHHSQRHRPPPRTITTHTVSKHPHPHAKWAGLSKKVSSLVLLHPVREQNCINTNTFDQTIIGE